MPKQDELLKNILDECRSLLSDVEEVTEMTGTAKDTADRHMKEYDATITALKEGGVNNLLSIVDDMEKAIKVKF